MNVHISYKVAKTPDIEQEFNHQIRKLRRRLQVFRPELVHLHGILEQNSAREGMVISLNLRLPSGQMAAQQSGPTAVAAIKGSFDDLLEQLSRHKDRLRSEYKWIRRRRVGRTRPQPQVPFEETFAAVQVPTVSAEDVRSYINANLQRLERFVERELRNREAAGILRPEQVSPEEVIDEAIANALGSNGEKPEKLALEPWLYRLAIRAIGAVSARDGENLPSVPLEQSARCPNVRASNEPQLQYHQPDETLTEEDIIPDRRTSTPEEIAASDEMITQVEAALLGAQRQDRDAFILFAIEGITAEEIAAITDRGVEQVRTSVTAAREHLRKALPMHNEFKDKLLEKTKIA